VVAQNAFVSLARRPWLLRGLALTAVAAVAFGIAYAIGSTRSSSRPVWPGDVPASHGSPAAVVRLSVHPAGGAAFPALRVPVRHVVHKKRPAPKPVQHRAPPPTVTVVNQ
jgi:hypothetical protein